MVMNTTIENINFLVAVLTKNDYPATKIHELLVNACGEIKSLRRIQEIAHDYRSNRRTGHSRLEGSGRPQAQTTDENMNKVKQLLDEDCHLSVRGVAAITGFSYSSVYRIISQKLLLKCVNAKWVPHPLTESHKVQRVQLAQELLRNLNAYTVVVDEKWVYCEPLPPGQNNTYWVAPGGDRPTISRRIISDLKYHIIVACNFRGDFRFQVLERTETINAKRYINFLQMILGMRRTGRLHLMHDNARPHMAAMTQAFCKEKGIRFIRQPPYSPDMNLLDRFVFRNLEFDRRITRFPNINCLSQYLQSFMENKMTRSKLSSEFDHLRNHLQKVIENNGNYI